MIEITKTTYTISNESVNFSCDEYEIELYNINGEITHEAGCGYEVDIDSQSVAISIMNEEGEDITEQVSDLEALKEELVENLIVEYGNLEFDIDICKVLENYLERS